MVLAVRFLVLAVLANKLEISMVVVETALWRGATDTQCSDKCQQHLMTINPTTHAVLPVIVTSVIVIYQLVVSGRLVL